jgi:hypothetical protein
MKNGPVSPWKSYKIELIPKPGRFPNKPIVFCVIVSPEWAMPGYPEYQAGSRTDNYELRPSSSPQPNRARS